MSGSGEIEVYGRVDCADTLRSRALLERERVPYVFVDVDAEVAAAQRAAQLSGGPRVPVIVLADGAVLVEPPDDELRAHLPG